MSAETQDASPPPADEPGGRHAICLNCGSSLVAEYCVHCGQAADVHRSLSAYLHDALHSVFHFDSKIWRTLPMLVWRPGELTRRYIQGERARFVSPMAMFLFSVVLLFAVMSATGDPFGAGRLSLEGVAEELTVERQRSAARLVELERQREQLLAARRSTAAVDASIDEARDELQRIDRLSAGRAPSGDRRAESPPLTTNLSWLEEAVRKANENPSLLVYKVQTNAYKFSWALIPISVPLLWLLFAFRPQFRAYDHAIFVTYSITFMMLLVAFLSVGAAIGMPQSIIVLAFGLVPLLHMYRQLKGAYGLSRFAALWRTFFLAWFAVLAVLLFFVLLVAIGIV